MFIQARANYVRSLGKKSKVSGLFVFSVRNQTYDNVSSLQASLPHRNVSIAGQAKYSYDQTYHVEFNFGLNASERFAENHRWGFFPSMGVAWNIANEAFWEPIHSAIPRFKLRVTYGLSGSDNIGPNDHRFSYLSQITVGDAAYGYYTGAQAGYYLAGIDVEAYPNKSITWEKARKLNIGIDFSLFHNLTIRANVFYQKRTDILMRRVDLPASMGLSNIPSANVGVVKSRGFDTHIKYRTNFNSNNWFLLIRGNYTFSKSEYVKYSEPRYPNSPNLSHIGQPVGVRFGLYAERLFIDEADVENSPPQSFGDYGPGDIKYRDVNGDGVITNRDKVPLGYPTYPQVTYGFGFSLSYQNFDFSAFFQGVLRETFWISSSASPYISNHQLLKVFAKNHWTTSNRNITALYPRFSTPGAPAGHSNNFHGYNSWFMQNGSFLRIKDVQIGYNLPPEWENNLGLTKFRIYLSARNLAHFSSFKLWDPEMAGNGLGYPLQQTFSIGLNIKF